MGKPDSQPKNRNSRSFVTVSAVINVHLEGKTTFSINDLILSFLKQQSDVVVCQACHGFASFYQKGLVVQAGYIFL